MAKTTIQRTLTLPIKLNTWVNRGTSKTVHQNASRFVSDKLTEKMEEENNRIPFKSSIVRKGRK